MYCINRYDTPSSQTTFCVHTLLQTGRWWRESTWITRGLPLMRVPEHCYPNPIWQKKKKIWLFSWYNKHFVRKNFRVGLLIWHFIQGKNNTNNLVILYAFHKKDYHASIDMKWINHHISMAKIRSARHHEKHGHNKIFHHKDSIEYNKKTL